MPSQQPGDYGDQSQEIKVHPNTHNPDVVWDTIKNKQKYEVVKPVDPSSPKPKGEFTCRVGGGGGVTCTHATHPRLPMSKMDPK